MKYDDTNILEEYHSDMAKLEKMLENLSTYWKLTMLYNNFAVKFER
jgi:hypothetical protein